MLGTDGRLYDSNFDFDGDGKLNAYEYSVMDDVVFGHEDTETSEEDELEDELSLAGLDVIDLEYMDADERKGKRHRCQAESVRHLGQIRQCRQQEAGMEVRRIRTERRSRTSGYGRTRLGKQYDRSDAS